MRCGLPILEKRPQPFANRGRQHRFEVFERRALQVRVAGMKPAKCYLQRLSRQHQRQQREHMRQALARPVAHEVIHERGRLVGFERVE